MPSNRRVKASFLIVAVLVLLTLYITASARQTRSSQFYTTTQDALSAARAAKEAKLHDSEHALGEDDSVSHRLRAAEEAAKSAADRKGDDFHGEETKQKAIKVKESLEKDGDEVAPKKSSLESSGSSSKSKSSNRKDIEEGEKGVAGRVIMKDPKEAVLKSDVKGKTDKEAEEADEEEKEKSHEESEDEKKAHAELNDILKKSPIIIFSKTYCPYSRRAKHILLEKYKIMPPPYVVELDIHPLGRQLQAYLGSITGRKTVPNVLIQAKSIGGGDDVQALDNSGELMDTIRQMGGKRMQISKVDPDASKEEAKPKVEARKRRRHFWS